MLQGFRIVAKGEQQTNIGMNWLDSLLESRVSLDQNVYIGEHKREMIIVCDRMSKYLHRRWCPQLRTRHLKFSQKLTQLGSPEMTF